MDIQANIIRLMGSVLCVFWYAVYALALFFIFATGIWLAIKDSSGITAKKQTDSNFAINQNQLGL